MGTPWRLLIVFSFGIMVAQIAVLLLDGFGLQRAILWGLLCGPGWLAVLAGAALAMRFFGFDFSECD